MFALTLAPVVAQTWRDVIQLSVSPEDAEFIDTNAVILLEGFYSEKEAVPLAITLSTGEVIGFTQYTQHTDHTYIDTFMIDKRFQGQGFGKQAFAQLLSVLPPSKQVRLRTKNPIAAAMYQRFGFLCVETQSDAEIEMRL